MRSVLVLALLFALFGLAKPSVAVAASCNAGPGCNINCSNGCGCIYDEEEKSCFGCWCEGEAPELGNLTIDFNGTSWSEIRRQGSTMDVLKSILKPEVINCLDKRGGRVTLSSKSAPAKQIAQQFEPLCR
jgi:hypothetical protein